MYPVGILFGLGFDTATEIALIVLSTDNSQAAFGWSIIIFPLLFTAGMTLIDTTDSVMITGAYHWAFKTPARKIYYNLIVTTVSVITAFVIGSLELIQTLLNSLRTPAETKSLTSFFAFKYLGYFIVVLFIIIWLISSLRWRRLRKKTYKL